MLSTTDWPPRATIMPASISSEMPDDGSWSHVWAQKPFFATRRSGRITEDAMLSTTGWTSFFAEE